MAGRIMAPTDIHVLMGNNIADERKVTNMLTIKQRDYPLVITKVHKSEKESEGGVTTAGRHVNCNVAGFEDGGRGP